MLKNGVFNRSACSPIASPDAELISPTSADDLVALDQLLRLGDRGLRIHAVLRDHLDLASEHSASGVDLLDGERRAAEPVLADLREEPGTRRDMAELDRVGLSAHERGKTERDDCGGAERGRPF